MSKTDIAIIIEQAHILNAPLHSGFAETACRSLLDEVDRVIRAYASGDIYAASQIQRDMQVNFRALDTMLIDARLRRPLKYHCGDCGATWRGDDALEKAKAARCAPYDDEIRPRAGHLVTELQSTFDEVAE